MALSTGGLAAIILFLILLHVAAALTYYYFTYLRSEGFVSSPKFEISDQMVVIMRYVGLTARS